MTVSVPWIKDEAVEIDQRHAPATLRNRDAILEVLRNILPASGKILEVASGTGEHIVYFADKFTHLKFQPSDLNIDYIRSISIWAQSANLKNIEEPIVLDAERFDWNISDVAAILCINMVHISPWEATIGLFRNAIKLLPVGSPLYIYGPFIREGFVTAESNLAFEASLKSRNLQWGIRRVDEMDALAEKSGLERDLLIEMPANNLSLVYRKL